MISVLVIGLKVILSLPDEGLIIDNIPDPNQSWMYKRSELLYFWHDSNYLDLIVIITINRSGYHTNVPFSASIFRLRGHQSVQTFLQRAQQFFAELLATSLSRSNSKVSLEKSATTDDNKKKDKKNKSKHRSTTPINEQSVINSPHPRQTTPIRLVTRAEFDPGKTSSVSHSNNHRTYSETTTSSDTQSLNLKRVDNHHNENEKTPIIANQLLNDHVAELVRELKELRNEIASLKIEPRCTPVRSISTSPVPQFVENIKQRMNSSTQSDVNVETQTDFSLIKPTPVILYNSNGLRSNSSGMNGIPSAYVNEQYQSPSFPIRPVPVSKTHQDGLTPYPTEKLENTKPLLPIQEEQVVSFRSSLEDTVAIPENIYANVPVLLKTESNQAFYYNAPIFNANNQQQQPPPPKSPLNITIVGNQNSESEQQYLSHLFGSQNGISSLIPQQSSSTSLEKENTMIESPETRTNTKSYPEQVVFANHLTNPLFNIDRQLLANTIANQFGVDLNSPYLQKLITNQHLFLANKRTFANMVWQMSPEEQNLLCSSPVSTIPDVFNANTVHSDSSTAKSILKLNKSSRSIPKKQRISWDRTLE